MITLTASGLYCEAGGFHIDPWQPVRRAVITHAHGDHARPGSSAYLTVADGERLLRRRLGDEPPIDTQRWGEERTVGDVRLSFHPAGHVRGAAQIRLEGPGGVWVASGDYKRAADPTCPAFEPLACDTFITEATFALPVFRWDPTEDVVADLLAWWRDTAGRGRAAVLFCYALGKAQRVLAELGRATDREVLIHGALDGLVEEYRRAGVAMARTRPVGAERRRDRFAGELIVAPPAARGSLWMRRFGDHSSGFASGWMRVRGERRRRGYDRGFPLSDHADWPALMTTIAETGAERVIATHGYTEPLARYVRGQGAEAIAWQTAFEGEVDQPDVVSGSRS